MNDKTVTLDVREDLRQGGEPFSKIMRAVAALRDGEQLRLIAPFEPVPLFHVMERQGFRRAVEVTEAGDWNVLFTRQSGPPPADADAPAISNFSGELSAHRPAEIVEVDVRGLEPPQPMVRILETLAALPAEAQLHACTDRRPLHLYPELEARGFTAETREQSDGSFITHIRRR